MILTYSKEQFKAKILAGTKIHSIRRDKANRWKRGIMIQHWLHSPRHPSKHPHQFASGQCLGIQSIEIYHIGTMKCIDIDGKSIDSDMLESLAMNDGFESVRQFLLWFNEDFKGIIIHFTDFKYEHIHKH